MLDSGGFTELSMHGAWTLSGRDYAIGVRRIVEQVGLVDAVAIQDWMCEPPILEKTGLTVLEHQARTVASFLVLRELAPDLPWMPVIQGWYPDDYERHIETYGQFGVDLRTIPLVGVGSVCRRQAMGVSVEILRRVSGAGIRVHGFGFKLTGLRAARPYLTSADSMAWSYDARRRPALAGCSHKNCANCLAWALRWRERALRKFREWQQPLPDWT
jgi:hypothetical protein